MNIIKKVLTVFLLPALVITFIICDPVETHAGDYTYYDSTYHIDSYGDLDKHGWLEEDYDGETYDEVIKQATLKSKGKLEQECWACDAKRTVKYKWSLDIPESDYNKSYNVIDHSVVYRSSTSITVRLHHVQRGSIVKVKIGKKKYSKKVGSKKKIKIKIKNPKVGSKVTIKVYYHGKLIGETYWWDSDEDEYIYETGEKVYYAKNIRQGMTKSQVKNTYYWGSASDTASSSGGWSYWYYDDGSYIDFKNGRVVYWYDAAG